MYMYTHTMQIAPSTNIVTIKKHTKRVQNIHIKRENINISGIVTSDLWFLGLSSFLT